MDNVEILLPFQTAMVDAYYNVDNADVTRTYTSYIDLVRYVDRKWELFGWRKDELEELQAQIHKVKTESRKTFSQFQACAMGTRKRHALRRFVNTLERLGDIRFPLAGFYENADKNLRPN